MRATSWMVLALAAASLMVDVCAGSGEELEVGNTDQERRVATVLSPEEVSNDRILLVANDQDHWNQENTFCKKQKTKSCKKFPTRCVISGKTCVTILEKSHAPTTSPTLTPTQKPTPGKPAFDFDGWETTDTFCRKQSKKKCPKSKCKVVRNTCVNKVALPEGETKPKTTKAPTVSPTASPTETPTISFESWRSANAFCVRNRKKCKNFSGQCKTVGRTCTTLLAMPPTGSPTKAPSLAPTMRPTKAPTKKPTMKPTKNPTMKPTPKPTPFPTSEYGDGYSYSYSYYSSYYSYSYSDYDYSDYDYSDYDYDYTY